ncbi:hypothetical protein ACFLYB_01475 [Chloroflexota bacterium]
MAKLSKLKSERKIGSICFYIGTSIAVVGGILGGVGWVWGNFLVITGLIMLGYMFNSFRSLLDEVINNYSS